MLTRCAWMYMGSGIQIQSLGLHSERFARCTASRPSHHRLGWQSLVTKPDDLALVLGTRMMEGDDLLL